jgi:hypothetical protein
VSFLNVRYLTTLLVAEDYMASMILERMNMERWRNDTDKTKPTYSEKNLPHCHYVDDKPHVDWPKIERGAPREEAVN